MSSAHLIKNIPFLKFQATGNDFLIFDGQNPKQLHLLEQMISPLSRNAFAQKICNRNFGLGADGFIILAPPPKDSSVDVIWDFFNSDGTPAEMCGNALRCVGLHCLPQMKKTEMSLQTLAGVRKIYRESDEFCTNMGPLNEVDFQLKRKFKSIDLFYDFVNSGVPHYVLTLNDISDLKKLKILAAQLRPLKDHSETGCNVTFYQKMTPRKLKCVTFERGVEDFTLSCGTGAVAAAYSHINKVQQNQKITVQLPGGKVKVEFKNKSSFLTGPAKFIGQIELSKSF